MSMRMMMGLESEKVDFVHTFLYDGDEERDLLEGDRAPPGSAYGGMKCITGTWKCRGITAYSMRQRQKLLTWRPRLPEQIYREQMAGKRLVLGGNEKELVESVLKDMPFWDTYDVCQDSRTHL